jgi:hypothetical protein
MNKTKILNVLKQIHPNTKISTESIQIIQNLFNIFDGVEHDEILKELLNLKPYESELYKFALKESNKKNVPIEKNNAINEYLLAEILELSGNSARDNKLKTINATHIWLAIFNDDELKKLFSNNLPSISPFYRINPEIYDKYKSLCMPQLNKIKDTLKQNNIKYEPIIIKNIKYILNYFTNLCSSNDELVKKIICLNLNETIFSIQKYHQIILQKLIDKMIIINKKVNYTILNDIFEDIFPNIKFDINYYINKSSDVPVVIIKGMR